MKMRLLCCRQDRYLRVEEGEVLKVFHSQEACWMIHRQNEAAQEKKKKKKNTVSDTQKPSPTPTRPAGCSAALDWTLWATWLPVWEGNSQNIPTHSFIFLMTEQ